MNEEKIAQRVVRAIIEKEDVMEALDNLSDGLTRMDPEDLMGIAYQTILDYGEEKYAKMWLASINKNYQAVLKDIRDARNYMRRRRD
jgi:hypothetical protein